MCAARCLLDVPVRRLSQGAAFQALCEHLECLSQRGHLGLQPAHALGQPGDAFGGR